MQDQDEDQGTIRRILEDSGDTWAVVGLSSNEGRAAYRVAEVLQRHGKRVVPVHPKAETVLGKAPVKADGEAPPQFGGVPVERHLTLVVIAVRAERGSEIRVALGVHPPALLGLSRRSLPEVRIEQVA